MHWPHMQSKTFMPIFWQNIASVIPSWWHRPEHRQQSCWRQSPKECLILVQKFLRNKILTTFLACFCSCNYYYLLPAMFLTIIKIQYANIASICQQFKISYSMEEGDPISKKMRFCKRPSNELTKPLRSCPSILLPLIFFENSNMHASFSEQDPNVRQREGGHQPEVCGSQTLHCSLQLYFCRF